MIYWGLDDALAIGILVFAALSVYISYDITRVSEGSPRAWNLFIAAFVVLLVYRAVQLYFDLLSPSGIIDDWEALISLIANALLVAGLALLDYTFRKHLRVLQAAQ